MRIETQIANAKPKPRVAVHKFTSCDGCQLAFLNSGESLLQLSELVEFVHFVEMGPTSPESPVDIAFIEGSVSTESELIRIKQIRDNSRYLISIGACATSGGLQALRNMHDAQHFRDDWLAQVYANTEVLESLPTATPISAHVRVDLELWGCPVNQYQVFSAIRDLLFGVSPLQQNESLCIECKRVHNTCVMVTQGMPCMGPVTRTGCGAICPRHGRDCYACFGPSENGNTTALGNRLSGLGLLDDDIAQRFLFINNQSPANLDAAKKYVAKQGTGGNG